MKHLLLSFCLIFSAYCISAQDFPERPNPPRLVNDLAGMLDENEEATLERKLVDYNDSTSTQIAIVTLKSLGDYDAGAYSFELGRRWGIGQKGKNNGVLLLVSLEDRHSFISVGYGLEGVLPDGKIGQIRDQYLRPNLRTGNYYAAFDQSTTAIVQLAAGQFKGAPQQKGKKGGSIIPLLVLGFIFFFVVLPIFRRGRRVRGNHVGGGGLNWLTTLFLLNSMGRDGRRDGSSWGDFSGGRGDFGGGDGGGFGGFGGGDFGGGGAGGDW